MESWLQPPALSITTIPTLTPVILIFPLPTTLGTLLVVQREEHDGEQKATESQN